MIHTLPCIWIHAVWSTKDKAPFIQPSIEKAVHMFIANQLEDAGCTVRIINGMPDHVHCLFRQNAVRTVPGIIKQVKGSSSLWINRQQMIPARFAWQRGYAVYSVSPSSLEWLQHHIREQKVHHQQKTYHEEMGHFLRMHGMGEVRY
ncbi:MAG: transposase [Chitinophagales bacterium]|nr:transposase [Chitinophagales bacterium]